MEGACAETGGVSFEVGTPLPRAGEARGSSAVTAPLRLRGAGRLRSRGRWPELRRRGPLGLGDTKQPDGPAGLHGGCTEWGSIRGTRPRSQLMTAWASRLWPRGSGRPTRSASLQPRAEAARRRGSQGGRGGRGAQTRACLGLRLRLGPPPLAQVAQLRARGAGGGGWGGSCVLPILPSPSPAAPGKLLKASCDPQEMGAGVGWGLGTRGVCVCVSVLCACAAGSTSRLLTDPGLLIDFHVKRVQSSR